MMFSSVFGKRGTEWAGNDVFVNFCFVRYGLGGGRCGCCCRWRAAS